MAKDKRGGWPRWRRVLRWIEHVLAGVGLMTLVYLFTFDVSVITSSSMSPTLQGSNLDNGDRVLTEKVSCRFRAPRRWEVIAYTRDDGIQIMKRVAGLPGERVQLSEDRRLVIDGQPVDLPAGLETKYLRFGNLVAGQSTDCGTGYYVLGDDLKDSDDSRFNGPIQPNRIIGRAWLILGPSSRRGFVR